MPQATAITVVAGVTDTDHIVVTTPAGLRRILKSSLLVAAGKVTVDDTGFTNLSGEDLDAILAAVDAAIGTVPGGASDVAVTDAGDYYTGTDVEAVLQEVGTALDNVSSAAADVTVADAGAFFTGTDAEAALQEVGRVNPEADADGQRIPVRNAAGAIVGYLGYSVGGDVFGLWFGDADGAINYDTPLLSLAGGGVFTQNDTNSASLLLAGNVDGGAATLSGANLRLLTAGTIKLINSGATGVDGTATPSTAAELADVLVDLGVIASHTIT